MVILRLGTYQLFKCFRYLNGESVRTYGFTVNEGDGLRSADFSSGFPPQVLCSNIIPQSELTSVWDVIRNSKVVRIEV